MSFATMTDEVQYTSTECRECGFYLEVWEIDLSTTRDLCSCCVSVEDYA